MAERNDKNTVMCGRLSQQNNKLSTNFGQHESMAYQGTSPPGNLAAQNDFQKGFHIKFV